MFLKQLTDNEIKMAAFRADGAQYLVDDGTVRDTIMGKFENGDFLDPVTRAVYMLVEKDNVYEVIQPQHYTTYDICIVSSGDIRKQTRYTVGTKEMAEEALTKMLTDFREPRPRLSKEGFYALVDGNSLFLFVAILPTNALTPRFYPSCHHFITTDATLFKRKVDRERLTKETFYLAMSRHTGYGGRHRYDLTVMYRPNGKNWHIFESAGSGMAIRQLGADAKVTADVADAPPKSYHRTWQLLESFTYKEIETKFPTLEQVAVDRWREQAIPYD